MLSSDCIYIYIYWRGGNKLKAVLAMGFAGWKLGDFGSGAESGRGVGWCWRGRGAKIPLFGWKSSRERSTGSSLCPEGRSGGAIGNFGGLRAPRGVGDEAIQAQVSLQRDKNLPGTLVPEGDRRWQWHLRDALLHLGWGFIFPAVPSGDPQREGRKNPEGLPMLKMRISSFPSWDRLEKFHSEALLHGKIKTKQILGRKKKKIKIERT